SYMSWFFNSFDIFVFTFFYECYASTCSKTLQYGVPTLAWNVSSNTEIIEDKLTVLLATLGNIEELAEKTKELLGENAKVYTQNGYKKVKETFDSKKNLLMLNEIID